MTIGVKVPEGYIPGMDRSTEANKKVSHLYKGTFHDPGLPMCRKGWNRDSRQAYSIWRNNISKKGICNTCLRNALQGKGGVSS